MNGPKTWIAALTLCLPLACCTGREDAPDVGSADATSDSASQPQDVEQPGDIASSDGATGGGDADAAGETSEDVAGDVDTDPTDAEGRIDGGAQPCVVGSAALPCVLGITQE